MFDFMRIQSQISKMKVTDNLGMYALMRDNKLMVIQQQVQKIAKTG